MLAQRNDNLYIRTTSLQGQFFNTPEFVLVERFYCVIIIILWIFFLTQNIGLNRDHDCKHKAIQTVYTKRHHRRHFWSNGVEATAWKYKLCTFIAYLFLRIKQVCLIVWHPLVHTNILIPHFLISYQNEERYSNVLKIECKALTFWPWLLGF